MALTGRQGPPSEHAFSPHDAVLRTAAPHVARRRFLTVTAAAAMLALSTNRPARGASAAPELDAARITDDPFTLGVASGDPLPDSVLIWTRLAPEPLAEDGGLGRQRVVVSWEMAMDEWFLLVEQSGVATAHPEYAHSVHVDVRRGYVRVELGRDTAQVDFRTVSAITRPGGTITTTASFVTEVGSPGLNSA